MTIFRENLLIILMPLVYVLGREQRCPKRMESLAKIWLEAELDKDEALTNLQGRR